MPALKLGIVTNRSTGDQVGEMQPMSREQAQAIKKAANNSGTSVDVKDPNGNNLAEEISPGDGLNLANVIKSCLEDALHQHGDQTEIVFIDPKRVTNQEAVVYVKYKPTEDGQTDTDEFVFKWDNGKLRLDNVANPVELCQLQKQSGTVNVQKDLVKANLLKFLQSHDDVNDSEPADPNALPDGQPVDEKIGGISQSGDGNAAYEGVDDAQSYKTDSDGHLWESEECQQAFCDAVDMYRKAKSKESIKNLFRAARPYQKGNTIQEKLKGAVDWYNIYTQKPPKNTKEQVFLEDSDLEEGYVPGVITALQKLSEGLDILKNYINRTEDTHLGAYFRPLDRAYDSLFEFCKQQGLSKHLNEFMDLNDPIANGEPNNYGGGDPRDFDNDERNREWEDYDDEPVVSEEDEWGPEVGDDVDYEGGHYRLYGYCGYEVVLQNVDDERDFKVVKPENVGIKAPQKDLKETNWVDPDELPDNETQRI